MIRKRFITAMASLYIILTVTACSSYWEIEDSVKNRLKGESAEEEYVNPVKIPGEEEKGESRLYHMGEMVRSVTPMNNEEMQYTVKSARIVENIYEAGLLPDRFSPLASVNDRGEVEHLENECFLILTVDIRNENSSGEQCVEWGLGSESGILEKSGPHVKEACYFAGMEQIGEKNKKFYFFLLNRGETRTVQLGWIVPDSYLEEPIYYVITNEGAAAETWKYILIDEIEK